MLEDYVVNIIKSGSNAGGLFNDLVDEFRSGRSAFELFPLLDSQNLEVLGLGIWALSELEYERYCFEEIIERLMHLTSHDCPSIRFNALGALYPSLSSESQETRDLLRRLANDSNEGVRMSAEAAAARLAVTLD